MHPYQPRPIAQLDPVTHGDWTLKSFSIVYGNRPFDPSRFTAGRLLALACLPEPAVTRQATQPCRRFSTKYAIAVTLP